MSLDRSHSHVFGQSLCNKREGHSGQARHLLIAHVGTFEGLT
jgi:hypothetical protein